jgi:hypothetical protein
MSHSLALYHTLFQYDTLYKVAEEVPQYPEVPAETPAAPEPAGTSASGTSSGVDTSGVDTSGVDTSRVEAPKLEATSAEAPADQVPLAASAPQPQPVTAGTLPASPPVPAENVPEVPSPFPALQHKVLVLVDEPAHPELVASQALLLENILKAVGCPAGEADVVNYSYIPTADARVVLADKLTGHFITFGVPLIKLQLDLLLPPYTPKQVEGIWFLLADPLSVIEQDKNLKRNLWLALQKMFAVG